jgi:hypothetical protein
MMAEWTDATPWPWPAPAPGPDLVACPLSVSPGVLAAVSPEIYRLAYERALAAARPGRYEFALGASRN